LHYSTDVPAKPTWYRRLPAILDALRNHPRTYVDRATVEWLLGVNRRRAQQIMAPCVSDHVGGSALADRDALIARLQRIAEGEDAFYEIQRRRKLAGLIEQLRHERVKNPALLVEAPDGVVNQEFQNLPDGVRLQPGCITVEFAAPHEGLEKLLALAMAISNDYQSYERRVSPPSAPAP
jgi:hypothetical protein